MAAFDLADWLYPDAPNGRQPQGPSQLSDWVIRSNSCVFLPSAGGIDMATGNPFSIVGTVEKTINRRGIGIYSHPTKGTYYRNLVTGDGIKSRPGYILFSVFQLTGYDSGYNPYVVDLAGGYGTRIAVGSCSNYQTPTGVGCHVRPNNQNQSIDSTYFTGDTNSSVSVALFVKTGQKPILIALHESWKYEEIQLPTTVTNASDAYSIIAFASNGYMQSVPQLPSGRRLMLGGVLAQDNISLQMARDIATSPWSLFESPLKSVFIGAAAGGGSTLNASASGGDVASGSASLSAQVALASVGVSTASGSAALAASVPLSAVGLSVAAGSAIPSATVTISASGLAQAAGQAGLSASVLAQAAGAALASGNATLAAQLNALATGAAQAGGSANLSGGAAGSLSASGAAIAAGTAVLSVTVGLQAAGSALASGTATGSANAPGQVSAAGGATAGGSAVASLTVALTAAGFVQAMGAGVWSVSAPLAAFGGGVSAGSGVLSLVPDGSISAVSEWLLSPARPGLLRVPERRLLLRV